MPPDPLDITRPEMIELDLRIGSKGKVGIKYAVYPEVLDEPMYLQHVVEKLFSAIAEELKAKGFV